jgi:predicted dehydrogenase
VTSLDVAESANGPYRAAIIGCGRMAHGHARAWNADPRAELVACADLFPEAATAFATEFGIPATYTDYREMLTTERPDVISICTHHHLHAPMTIDAARLATPRAILCEKPIALDLASADEMIAACEEVGTRLIVGHQRRFDRQTQPVKQAVDAGEIGEVLLVEAFGHPRSSLLVDSTHTVDLVRYLLGDPRGAWVLGQIDAREHRSAWGQEIEDCALAWIGFDNGARLLLGAGSAMGEAPDDRISISPEPVTGGTYHRIVLHGTTGRLVLNGDRPNGDGPLVTIHQGAETDVLYTATEFNADPTWSSVDAEVSALLDCLDEPGLPHLLEAESARATLEILMGIYESSRRRRAIRIPQDAPPDNALISMLAEGLV